MKFVYTGGKYAEFRGYVFAFGNPVTITDKATTEALLKHSDFKRYEEPVPATPELVPDEVIPKKAIDKDACPKCGKVIKQGKYLHVKFCKGL